MSPADRPIRILPDIVAHHAARAPEATAVRFAGTSLTWAELDGRTARLASALRDLGVRRGDRVGILLGRSVELAVALYGIPRAGAAYVPLDPAAPAERLAFLARDCGLDVVVTHEARRATCEAARAAGWPVRRVIGLAPGDGDAAAVAVAWEDVDGFAPTDDAQRPAADDLAYVIYTSGSTGAPKGIQHSHASSLAFCESSRRLYDLQPDDRFSNQAPIHFDMSIFDFFVAGLAGGSVSILSEAHLKLPASLSQWLETERISIFFSVPFALTQLVVRGALESRDLSGLRQILWGGEVMPIAPLRELMTRLPHVRFHNMYGPAETNGCTTFEVRTPPSDDRNVPIGSMFPGMTGAVVGADGELVPDGEAGELWVAGPSQMLGYWNRPDLNERSLVRRVDADGAERTFYRTGDHVVRDADGTLHFVGRRDRQIKIRGYRVELDEVEAALAAQPGVEEAAVFAPASDPPRIEAAVILRPGAETAAGALEDGVRRILPPYAVPARIALAEDFPRTTSGKVDYRALAAAHESPL
ncbi:MAG: amino acid adenylation domain-containing protein [bacterium]